MAVGIGALESQTKFGGQIPGTSTAVQAAVAALRGTVEDEGDALPSLFDRNRGARDEPNKTLTPAIPSTVKLGSRGESAEDQMQDIPDANVPIEAFIEAFIVYHAHRLYKEHGTEPDLYGMTRILAAQCHAFNSALSSRETENYIKIGVSILATAAKVRAAPGFNIDPDNFDEIRRRKKEVYNHLRADALFRESFKKTHGEGGGPYGGDQQVQGNLQL